MNDLEKILKREGVLVPFIKNCDLEHLHDKNIFLTCLTAFIWKNTKEGESFWYNISHRCQNSTISRSRIVELKKIYTKLPPRYKESL